MRLKQSLKIGRVIIGLLVIISTGTTSVWNGRVCQILLFLPETGSSVGACRTDYKHGMESNEKQLGTLYEWPESSNPGRAYINIGVVPLTPGPSFTMQKSCNRPPIDRPWLTHIPPKSIIIQVVKMFFHKLQICVGCWHTSLSRWNLPQIALFEPCWRAQTRCEKLVIQEYWTMLLGCRTHDVATCSISCTCKLTTHQYLFTWCKQRAIHTTALQVHGVYTQSCYSQPPGN